MKRGHYRQPDKGRVNKGSLWSQPLCLQSCYKIRKMLQGVRGCQANVEVHEESPQQELCRDRQPSSVVKMPPELKHGRGGPDPAQHQPTAISFLTASVLEPWTAPASVALCTAKTILPCLSKAVTRCVTWLMLNSVGPALRWPQNCNQLGVSGNVCSADKLSVRMCTPALDLSTVCILKPWLTRKKFHVVYCLTIISTANLK